MPNGMSVKSALARPGVMILVGLAAGSAYLTRHCIAALNTTIQADLEISPESMGWVLGAFSAGYFLCQIPGGWLGNRIGSRTAFSAISTAWSVFTMWTAVAGGLAGLFLSRVFFGAAQAGLVPISAKVINDWFSVRWRGRCSAVVGAAMSAGGVLTMWLTAVLMPQLHWRTIFFLYSTVGIVWAAMWYLFFRTRPEDHPWLAAAEPPDSEEAPATHKPGFSEKTGFAHGQPSSDATELPSSADVLLHVATSRTLWGINGQSFFRAAGYMLLVTWYPAYLEYRFSISSEEAATLTIYPLAGVIGGTLVGGLVVDLLLRVTGSRWISRCGTSILALGGSGGLACVAAGMPTAGELNSVMAAVGFFSGLGSPPAWAATMDVSGRCTAVIMGAMNMAGTAGGFTLPVVVGYMIGDIQATGGNWNNVIYLVGVIYFLGALCWLAVNPDDAPPVREHR